MAFFLLWLLLLTFESMLPLQPQPDAARQFVPASILLRPDVAVADFHGACLQIIAHVVKQAVCDCAGIDFATFCLRLRQQIKAIGTDGIF